MSGLAHELARAELLKDVFELDEYERGQLLVYLVGYAPDAVRLALVKVGGDRA